MVQQMQPARISYIWHMALRGDKEETSPAERNIFACQVGVFNGALDEVVGFLVGPILGRWLEACRHPKPPNSFLSIRLNPSD